MRLGILQKGWIVVGVPLLFTFLFVGILLSAENHLLVTLEDVAHARRIITALHNIQRIVEQGAIDLADYKRACTRARRHPGPESEAQLQEQRDAFKALKSSAKDSLSELKAATENNADDKAKVEKIEAETNKALKMFDECAEKFIEENEFQAFSENANLLFVGLNCKKRADELSNKYSNFEKQRIGKQISQVKIVQNFIIGGLVFSMLLALAVAQYFSRSIAKRILILQDNTTRLVNRQELHPPLSENDEITTMDRAFRNMSKLLRKAEEEEIAARKAAEASEERTRSVIDNMPVGIIVMDNDHMIQSLNPRALQMFQFSQDNVRNLPVTKILQENPALKSAKSTNEIKRGTLTNPSIAGAESFGIRSNGDMFPAEIAITKFSTEEGKHFLATVQDITERHEMERLKREFVSMVSHDLRTPLTAVQGTLDLIDEDNYGEISEQGHKRVKVASESVDRLINLINDLLDIEKMEAGKMRLEPKPIELQSILTHSLESIRTFADNSEVKLSLIEDGDLKVNVDKDRIVQVVVNLLSNSVKFSPPGSTITVSSIRQNNMALVRVIDQGRGIPKEFLGSLFERFKQVKASDGKRKNGTGLGLAICKAIVESHGGSIGVSSEEGKGAEFFFTVPLA